MTDTYYINVPKNKGKGYMSFEVLAQYKRGYFYQHPKNERQYLDPGDGDIVDILKVFMCFKKKRREIKKISSTLSEVIEEQIISYENARRRYEV